MKCFCKAKLTDEVFELESRNKEIAYEAAVEGIVLLKNDGALPLKEKRVALYGSGVSRTIKGGTGSGEVKERHSCTILEGMKEAGFEITSMDWINDYEANFNESLNAYKEKSKKQFNLLHAADFEMTPFFYPVGREITDEEIKASKADAAIYVVSRQSGEGHDRKLNKGENDLNKEEIAHIKKLAQGYEKFILVINVGSSLNLNSLKEFEDDINAVVFFCQQGMMGGIAFADIISGKRYPSGKLSDTWSNNYTDLPFNQDFSYLNGDTTNENYKEGIYVGYRFYDSFNVKPRYAFGYGLGYTSFEITKGECKLVKDKVSIKANVKNTGTYNGKEVVEVYVGLPNGSIDKEYKRLVGIKKTKELKANESQDLEFSFSIKDAASYFEDKAAFVLEKGLYIVKVGNSSDNVSNYLGIEVSEDVVISKHMNISKHDNKITKLMSEKKTDEKVDEVISLDKGAIKTVTYDYSVKERYSDEKVDKILNSLTTNEMIKVVVGDGVAGMMGQSKYVVTPGTVGLTTRSLFKKGLINVNLSDGPAGLRLQRVSEINKKGVIKATEFAIDALEYLPKFIQKVLMGNPNGEKLIYQNCSAFPVAMSLAQTFNTELVEKVGKAVGDEMNEYGVTYWLAPGMNIHRNPLCGRNFEYYSEDPFLSGIIASSITKGVQSHEGCYVTIKHFCCNNQEDNRYYSSSNVDERALREIYLKGFEIAVRDANAKALMTSYNKLNQVYTPNSIDLCTYVLRNEWGFDGVVMTDWFSTNSKRGASDVSIHVGNDLIMPGGSGARKTIKKGLKKGTVTIEELKKAAANVIRSIVYSNVAKEVKAEDFD